MQTAGLRIVLSWTVCLASMPLWAQAPEDEGRNGQPIRGAARAAGPSPTATVGQSAPDFELPDCNGKTHRLSDYRDKIVVLEWVNQQCPWSIKAQSVTKELRKKHQADGVVWLGIDSTFGRKPEEVVQYIKEKDLDIPVLMDGNGRVGRTYGAKTTPHVYLISRGKLVYAGALHNNQYDQKPQSEVRNYLDEALQAVLDGKEIPLPQTTPWGCSIKYGPGGGKATAEPRAKPKQKDQQVEE